MGEFVEGSVVISGTGQSGSVIQISGKEIWILLQNHDIWVGDSHQVRFPQDAADLAACPLNVDRIEKKIPAPDFREDP